MLKFNREKQPISNKTRNCNLRKRIRPARLFRSFTVSKTGKNFEKTSLRKNVHKKLYFLMSTFDYKMISEESYKLMSSEVS